MGSQKGGRVEWVVCQEQKTNKQRKRAKKREKGKSWVRVEWVGYQEQKNKQTKEKSKNKQKKVKNGRVEWVLTKGRVECVSRKQDSNPRRSRPGSFYGKSQKRKKKTNKVEKGHKLNGWMRTSRQQSEDELPWLSWETNKQKRMS